MQAKNEQNANKICMYAKLIRDGFRPDLIALPYA